MFNVGLTCNVVFKYSGIATFTLVEDQHVSSTTLMCCVHLCVSLPVTLDCAGKHKLRHFKCGAPGMSRCLRQMHRIYQINSMIIQKLHSGCGWLELERGRHEKRA